MVERRGETLLEEKKPKHGLKSERYSKHILYQIICIAYDNDKTKKENKEAGCIGHFKTRDPNRRFCSDGCRLKIWAKNNKDMIAKKQQRYRDREKKKFKELVQEIIDSKGVQEN